MQQRTEFLCITKYTTKWNMFFKQCTLFEVTAKTMQLLKNFLMEHYMIQNILKQFILKQPCQTVSSLLRQIIHIYLNFIVILLI